MITRFASPTFEPGCEVKSIADADEYTDDNGWIEAIVGGDNQQRIRYYGVPLGVQVGDFVDVEYFPAYKLYRVFGATRGGTATVGGIKVDKVWESDFDNPALYANATGLIGIGDSEPDSQLVVGGSANTWLGGTAVSGNTVQDSSFMEEGLVINSAAAKEMFALKDSAVAHGMTSEAETDTFGTATIVSGTLGGLRVLGYSESDIGVEIVSRVSSTDTTKTTNSDATVSLIGQLKSGTTVGGLGASVNIVAIKSNIGSPNTKWICDADGNTWQSGEETPGSREISRWGRTSFTTATRIPR
jgi:hypothetical protein